MKRSILLPASYAIGMALSLFGALQKILHAPSSESWLMVSLLAFVPFILIAAYEVCTSRTTAKGEKVMWTLALILFTTIAGLVYLLSSRKRVVAHP
ncbi:MAG: hypothetical protein EOO08_05475 [Chitinophagaceae bacterium]|nr:MAG: hypothetical protein EOO08_05475 [Chitinophagaceae bacterium]